MSYENGSGHMVAFARASEPGKRVRQEQAIGFVGRHPGGLTALTCI